MSDNDCLQEANGLLVLVILLEEVEDNNQELVPFLYALQELSAQHGTRTISEFLVASLVPRSTVEYYIYPGSLTFPPCTERVINVVFQRTVPIGRKQTEARGIYAHFFLSVAHSGLPLCGVSISR
ncbi:hypothetical protein V5799_003237 [Amblyomma americanum]|uniref:carbonic anhydrase n=1 Tax=Amblyomma americanum TaxID=6943 RepID=A0AAQ4D9J9_AMBAM